MWELPSAEAGRDPRRAAAALAAGLGVGPPEGPVASVRQVLTHRDLSVVVFAAGVPPRWRARAVPPYVDARIAPPGGAPGGVAAVTRKALAAADRA
jgi:hypothetical protein